MAEITKVVGGNIKALRKHWGLSVIQLAKHCGVSRNTIYCIERGSQWPSNELIEAIAEALEVEVTFLFKKPLGA